MKRWLSEKSRCLTVSVLFRYLYGVKSFVVIWCYDIEDCKKQFDQMMSCVQELYAVYRVEIYNDILDRHYEYSSFDDWENSECKDWRN